MQWTTGWAEVWDGPLWLSTSTLPSFSTLLQILMTWATKADHGSTRRQQGLICYYSAYSRLWSPVGIGDTWEQIFDRGHRTWPPSLLFLWIPCQRTFFSFASVWLIQMSHCASRERLVLWYLHHTRRLKGKGITDYSRLRKWICQEKMKSSEREPILVCWVLKHAQFCFSVSCAGCFVVKNKWRWRVKRVPQ